MNKGFTLVELLATMVIIAIIATITTVTMGNTIMKSKNSLSKSQKVIIEKAAKAYYIKEGDMDGTDSCINLGQLVSDGYIEADVVKDPKNNEVMVGSVDITYSSNEYYYTYKEGTCILPNSFEQDSWEMISKTVKSGNASKYYKVGDTKEIDMGTYGKHIVRIANMSTPSDCSTAGYSQTACGFVVEFTDIIDNYNMNPAGTYNDTEYDSGWSIGGYPGSQLYTFLQSNIYNKLPSDLKKVIISTTTVSGHAHSDTDNFTSIDKLYLLTSKEVHGNQNPTNPYNSDTADALTRQLDYYEQKGVTTSSYADAKKKYGKVESIWWFRTASRLNDTIFAISNNEGMPSTTAANYTYGISPAFRIG